jgi:hypothetical protein
MADPLMAPSETLGITPIQPTHPATEMGLGRFQEQVSDCPSGNRPSSASVVGDFLAEQRQKMKAISPIVKDRLLRIAPCSEVVEGPGIFKPQVTGHGGEG